MRKTLRWTARVLGVLIVALVVFVGVGYFVWVPHAKEPPYTRVKTWGHQGSGPGEFRDPNGIAVADGRVYVADSRNHRIQVFDRGDLYLSEIKVPADGRPMNLTVVRNRIYAADYWNDDVLIYSLDGRLLKTLGSPGTPGTAHGEFNSPGGGGVNPANGNIYVAGFYNQRVQAFGLDGRFLRQWGKTDHKGFFGHGVFNYPIDVAVNPNTGDFYVADGYNDRIQAFGPHGRFVRMWGAGPFGLHLPHGMNVLGSLPGWLKVPTGVAIDPHGNVFVADQENNRVQKFTADGIYRTQFGTRPNGSAYTVAAVAVAADGTVYVTNLADERVEVWRPAKVP